MAGPPAPTSNAGNVVALALGGGGARGIAHIGVLKVLEEERVPVDLLVGTSIGALGAALYGLTPSWRWVRERVFGYLGRSGFAKYGRGLTDSATGSGPPPGRMRRLKIFLMKWAALQALLVTRSLVSRRRLSEAVAGILPDRAFADLRIPVAVAALDLLSGREIVIRDGSLREAVVASASLAGFFPPFPFRGKPASLVRNGPAGGRLSSTTLAAGMLADPSPVSSVPVDAARALGARGVIAVDIRSRVAEVDAVRTGADAVFRMAAMACERANDAQVSRADVVIAPGVGSTYWSDFRNLDAHVELGERAAREAMPRVREMLARLGRA